MTGPIPSRRRFLGAAAAFTAASALPLVRLPLSHLRGGEPPAALRSLETQFAADLAAVATQQTRARTWLDRWRLGGFDHVEKHDDRVVAFATRLAAGRHEFSYLARATTAGTFHAPGVHAEAMYAPEINGRASAEVVTVK